MPLTVVLDTNVIVRAQISPASWSARIFDAFLDGRFSLAILTTALYEIQAVAADPDDNKFLVCGLEARADYIVSLDGHLLSMKEFRLLDYQVPIVEVAPFFDILGLQPIRT